MSACPGSGQRVKREEHWGYWLPCPECGKEFLPAFGGLLPTHAACPGHTDPTNVCRLCLPDHSDGEAS